MLGGAVRPVETTLAGCYPVATETPDTIAGLMATMAGYGAAGIKVTSSGDFARDTGRLRACRAALGDGTPLIVDLYGCAPDVATLLPHAGAWGALGMAWVEDPFGFDDLDELAALAAGLDYPVGVGDEQSGLSHFRNLIDYGRIGVVRLDATTCGGVTGFRRIAAHSPPLEGCRYPATSSIISTPSWPHSSPTGGWSSCCRKPALTPRISCSRGISAGTRADSSRAAEPASAWSGTRPRCTAFGSD